MPVFEPNEYFWKNHWDGKEEKWKAYARAMQQIMCEASGYKFSKNRIEDKFEYKKVIKGAKNQKFWRIAGDVYIDEELTHIFTITKTIKSYIHYFEICQ